MTHTQTCATVTVDRELAAVADPWGLQLWRWRFLDSEPRWRRLPDQAGERCRGLRPGMRRRPRASRRVRGGSTPEMGGQAATTLPRRASDDVTP
jgi:hypothetical protein